MDVQDEAHLAVGHDDRLDLDVAPQRLQAAQVVAAKHLLVCVGVGVGVGVRGGGGGGCVEIESNEAAGAAGG